MLLLELLSSKAHVIHDDILHLSYPSQATIVLLLELIINLEGREMATDVDGRPPFIGIVFQCSLKQFFPKDYLPPTDGLAHLRKGHIVDIMFEVFLSVLPAFFSQLPS